MFALAPVLNGNKWSKDGPFFGSASKPQNQPQKKRRVPYMESVESARAGKWHGNLVTAIHLGSKELLSVALKVWFQNKGKTVDFSDACDALTGFELWVPVGLFVCLWATLLGEAIVSSVQHIYQCWTKSQIAMSVGVFELFLCLLSRPQSMKVWFFPAGFFFVWCTSLAPGTFGHWYRNPSVLFAGR